MRVARYTTGDEPGYGVIGTADGEEVIAAVTGDPLYNGVELTGHQLKLADARLLAPVIPRSKVVCVGRNYAKHAAETGSEVPAEPLVFLKPNTSVIGPGDPITHPSQSQRVDHEAELAVVIGRICRDVPEEKVAEVVYGYTAGNDVTARDLQETDGQWARAKGFDTFCPLGPWIETELDPGDLRVTAAVNGNLRQDGRTSQMMYAVPTIIAYITSFMTLLPGDVVLTGTPAGIAPMHPGDEVSVTVEGIGSLTNKVVQP